MNEDVKEEVDTAKAADDSNTGLAMLRPFVRKHRVSLIVLGFYLLLIWILALIQQFGHKIAFELGILPRTARGLLGILLTNICHVGIEHVALNSFGVITLSYFLLFIGRGPREFVYITIVGVLGGGFFTWAVARGKLVHCGVSGLLFAHLLYLLCIPLFERPFQWKSLVGALVGGVSWGGLVLSLFSSEDSETTSWEGHLGGALAGSIWAVCYFWVRRRFNIDCSRCFPSKPKWARFKDADDADALVEVVADIEGRDSDAFGGGLDEIAATESPSVFSDSDVAWLESKAEQTSAQENERATVGVQNESNNDLITF